MPASGRRPRPAARPAPVTDQPNRVLRHQHASGAAETRALAKRVAASSPGVLRAGDAQGPGVAQRAGVAATLTSQGLSVRNAVEPVQAEGGHVEARVVMQDPAPTPPGQRAQPVGELMEEGEALVELIGSSRDRDASARVPRDAGRGGSRRASPAQGGQGDAGSRADIADQPACPGRRHHPRPERWRRISPSSRSQAVKPGSA